MKPTNYLLPALALALGLGVATSCSKSEKATDNTIEFKTISKTVNYQLEGTAKAYQSDNDIQYQDSATVILPVKIYGHDIKPLQDTIMSVAFDTIAPTFDEAINSLFVKAVADVGYEYKVAPDSLPRNDIDGSTIIEGEVYSISLDMLTYRITSYTYFPAAAHGLTLTNYVTYDLRKGQVINLQDLFTPAGLKQLPGLIAQRAKELEPAIGPTDIMALPSQGNFFIGLDDTITFVYQPYEVASYAQGLIAISFYPYQLTELMTPLGLEIFHLNL